MKDFILRNGYLVISLVFLLFSSFTFSGERASRLGMYLLPEEGGCRTTEFYGIDYPDTEVDGVCIPAKVMMDESKKDLLLLAITELKDPEDIDIHIELNEYRALPTEAFRVKVRRFDDGLFQLVGGTALEKVSGTYVGYVGYGAKGVLYKDLGMWKLCINGNIVRVKILKEGSNQSIYNKSVKEIEALDEC